MLRVRIGKLQSKVFQPVLTLRKHFVSTLLSQKQEDVEKAALWEEATAAKEISVDSGGFIRTRWHFHTVKTSMKILVVGKMAPLQSKRISVQQCRTSQLAKVRKRCQGASSCSFASQPAIKQEKRKKELALSDLSDGRVRPLTFPVLLRFSADSFWIRVI